MCALGCGSSAGSIPVVEVPPSVRKHTEWAVGLGGSGDVDIASIARGRDGTLYVGGSFAGELRAGGKQLKSVGPSDGFVATLSATGAVKTLRAYGSPKRDRITAVAFSKNRLWLAGDRGSEAFVLRAGGVPRGPFGNPHVLRASGHVVVRDIAATVQGGVIAVGQFSGDLTLDKERVTSAGSSDAFMARFDKYGKAVWLRRMGGPWADFAHAVAVRGNTVAVVGSFTRSAYFGTALVDARNRSQDAFLARYDLRGELQWIKPMGGDQRDTATAVAIDVANTIYTGGNFSGAASFGAEPIVSVDGPDAFVVAYTKAGKNLWTRRFGGASAERVVAMTAVGKRVYLAGAFVGTTRIETYAIRGERKHDGFVAAFTRRGDLHAGRPVSGIGDVAVRDLVVDAKGAVIVVGAVLGASEIVPGKPIDNDDRHTSGFVARLSP